MEKSSSSILRDLTVLFNFPFLLEGVLFLFVSGFEFPLLKKTHVTHVTHNYTQMQNIGKNND